MAYYVPGGKPIRRKRVTKSVRKPRKVYRKRTSVKTVKYMVKKEIARQAENKTQQYYIDDYSVYPSNAGSPFTSSFFPVSPYVSYLDITQGVGQGERIGNQIKIKKLSIKGNFTPAPYNVTTNPTPQPIMIVMRFFISRATPITIPTSMSGFMQLGDSSADLQNNLTDIWGPYNEDAYKVFARRIFKIGYSSYTGGGSGGGGPTQFYSNNDFKMNQSFSVDLTKYAIKTLKYNDTSSTPRMRGIFCSVQALNADGTEMGSTVISAKMAAILNVEYEDM